MFECDYTIPESTVSRSNQDGSVIIMKLDEGNTFFKINGVAAEIWKEISEKKKLNDIFESLVENYNAPKEIISADINSFIETLLSKDLITKI